MKWQRSFICTAGGEEEEDEGMMNGGRREKDCKGKKEETGRGNLTKDWKEEERGKGGR